jgi:hypothetical protein
MVKETIGKLTDEFCIEHLEHFMKNMLEEHRKSINFIMKSSLEITLYLNSLSERYGPEAAVGAMNIIYLLSQAEERLKGKESDTGLKKVLSQLTERFCTDQAENLSYDHVQAYKQAWRLINETSQPLQSYISALSQEFGIENKEYERIGQAIQIGAILIVLFLARAEEKFQIEQTQLFLPAGPPPDPSMN